MKIYINNKLITFKELEGIMTNENWSSKIIKKFNKIITQGGQIEINNNTYIIHPHPLTIESHILYHIDTNPSQEDLPLSDTSF